MVNQNDQKADNSNAVLWMIGVAVLMPVAMVALLTMSGPHRPATSEGSGLNALVFVFVFLIFMSDWIAKQTFWARLPQVLSKSREAVISIICLAGAMAATDLPINMTWTATALFWAQEFVLSLIILSVVWVLWFWGGRRLTAYKEAKKAQ